MTQRDVNILRNLISLAKFAVALTCQIVFFYALVTTLLSHAKANTQQTHAHKTYLNDDSDVAQSFNAAMKDMQARFSGKVSVPTAEQLNTQTQGMINLNDPNTQQQINQQAASGNGYVEHPDTINPAAVNAVNSNPDLASDWNSAATQPELPKYDDDTDFVKLAKEVQDNAEGVATGHYSGCNKIINPGKTQLETCTAPSHRQFDCEKHLDVKIIHPDTPTTCNQVVKIVLPQNSAPTPPAASVALLGKANWYDPFVGKFQKTVYYYLVSASASHPQNCYVDGSFKLVQANNNHTSLSFFVAPHAAALTHLDLYTLGIYQHHSSASITRNTQPITSTQVEGTGSSIADFKNDEDTQQAYVLALDANFTDHALPIAQLTATYTTQSYDASPTIQKEWVTTCPTTIEKIATSPICQQSEVKCIDNTPTKIIDGVPVSAACWAYQTKATCGGSGPNTCTPLSDRGCHALSSDCAATEYGICTQTKQTWSCPAGAGGGTVLQCGQDFFCMKGDCHLPTSNPSQDFDNSARDLSVLEEAGKDVKKQADAGGFPDPNNITLFKGKAAACRETILGALNCCKPHGWAKGWAMKCNAEERDLGHAREQGGLVIQVGRYCSERVLGACVEHKESFCIFPSRIAFDIQIQGRKNQLNIPFDPAESPNCSGITPEQLQQIDFSQIDFSNVVIVPPNMPNPADISKDVDTRVEDYYRQHAGDAS